MVYGGLEVLFKALSISKSDSLDSDMPPSQPRELMAETLARPQEPFPNHLPGGIGLPTQWTPQLLRNPTPQQG